MTIWLFWVPPRKRFPLKIRLEFRKINFFAKKFALILNFILSDQSSFFIVNRLFKDNDEISASFS